MKATFNAYQFNPVFWHIWDALHDPKIRKILVRGGSDAGKTFSVCDAVNIFQLEALVNCFALRKHRIHVEGTIKQSFETSIARLRELKDYYEVMDGEIRVATGARTLYAGLDDSEKVKGLESFGIIYCNELNQFEVGEWDELNRRLRGKPNLKLIADWNPIIMTHWINQEILSKDEGWQDLPLTLPGYEADNGAFTQLTPGYAFKRINAAGDTLWINITYRDNFWCIGHPGNTVPAVPGQVSYYDGDPARPVTLEEGMFIAPDGNLYGLVDTHQLANFERMKKKKPNDYRIYGMGQDGLIRTGGEAWKQYREEEHVCELQVNLKEIIHLSLDKNLVPYVTVSAWQVEEIIGKDGFVEITELRQVHEIDSRPPQNTAFRAALATGKWLAKIGYTGILSVCGDPSASAGSATDDDGRSFFDRFIATLQNMGYTVVNRVQRSAPAVATSIEFVNDIYAGEIPGYRIRINESCSVSREDYCLIKEDPKTGKFLKERVEDKATGQKYEKYGHFSDAKRYFIVMALFDLFTSYKKRLRTPRIMSVKQ